MNGYDWLKIIHLSFVGLSLILFFSRALMSIQGLDWRLKWPILKFIPHINDTFLLASGFTLAWYTSIPLLSGWLSVKLLLLVVYILLGSFTLKYARTQLQRWLGVIAAVITISLMISTALTKSFF